MARLNIQCLRVRRAVRAFRLRNKGIPYVNGRGRGDQYVTVIIEVPRNLTAKQKETLKEFEKTTSDRNYEKRKGFFDKIKDALRGEDDK